MVIAAADLVLLGLFRLILLTDLFINYFCCKSDYRLFATETTMSLLVAAVAMFEFLLLYREEVRYKPTFCVRFDKDVLSPRPRSKKMVVLYIII